MYLLIFVVECVVSNMQVPVGSLRGPGERVLGCFSVKSCLLSCWFGRVKYVSEGGGSQRRFSRPIVVLL